MTAQPGSIGRAYGACQERGALHQDAFGCGTVKTGYFQCGTCHAAQPPPLPAVHGRSVRALCTRARARTCEPPLPARLPAHLLQEGLDVGLDRPLQGDQLVRVVRHGSIQVWHQWAADLPTVRRRLVGLARLRGGAGEGASGRGRCAAAARPAWAKVCRGNGASRSALLVAVLQHPP